MRFPLYRREKPPRVSIKELTWFPPAELKPSIKKVNTLFPPRQNKPLKPRITLTSDVTPRPPRCRKANRRRRGGRRWASRNARKNAWSSPDPSQTVTRAAPDQRTLPPPPLSVDTSSFPFPPSVERWSPTPRGRRACDVDPVPQSSLRPRRGCGVGPGPGTTDQNLRGHRRSETLPLSHLRHKQPPRRWLFMSLCLCLRRYQIWRVLLS